MAARSYTRTPELVKGNPRDRTIHEVWRTIPGYRGFYKASTWGRVKSIDRLLTYTQGGAIVTRLFKGRVLKQQPTDCGHLMVVMPGKHRSAHRLILETFVGPCPPGKEACHWDDVGHHNWLSNLRWDTRENNIKDSIRTGCFYRKRGEGSGNSKLTEAQALEILTSSERSFTIAKRMGITQTNVYHIRLRKSWGHLKGTRAIKVERKLFAKLTESDVRAIRNSMGETAVALGKKYKVDPKTIASVRKGLTWKHVKKL